ncbi:thermonuclease family protein [Aquamicrobium lusatiense]|uniref:thermonuclease family protein n=1 Tax=Aquamicrobium lusatiense TaxID=89772 RepID=UPI00313B504B
MIASRPHSRRSRGLGERRKQTVCFGQRYDRIGVVFRQSRFSAELRKADVQLSAQQFKNRLAELFAGQYVVIHRPGTDRYGRTLAVVGVHGVDAGDVMVSEGLVSPNHI